MTSKVMIPLNNHQDEEKVELNKIDFVMLYSVEMGNPNGKPSDNGEPRQDSKGYGLVSDVSQKRKIRDYIKTTRSEPYNDIFFQHEVILNNIIEEARIESGEEKTKKSRKKSSKDKIKSVLAKKYIDVRAFGALLDTGEKAGVITGPINVNIAKSEDVVEPDKFGLTRCSATTENEDKDNKTMGSKYIIDYAMYRVTGSIYPYSANNSFLTLEDIDLFFEALWGSWTLDHSASRGEITPEVLIVVEHDTPIGNCSLRNISRALKVKNTRGDGAIPECVEDYNIELGQLPENTHLIEKWTKGLENLTSRKG